MTSIAQTMKRILPLAAFLVAAPIYIAHADGAYAGAPQASDRAAIMGALHKAGVQVQLTDRPAIIMQVDSLFRFPSSTRLLDTSRGKILDNVANLVRSYGNRLVTVSGHTDNVGSDASKLKRSKDQADTVAAFLWSRGVPLKNLTVIGCGDTEPVSSNKTPEGSASNRRIEIEIE